MQPNDKDSFLEWYVNTFHYKHKGWSPRHLSYWYDTVEKNHTNIRQLLGGIRFEKVYELKNQQTKVPLNELEPIIKEILAILPDYFEFYKFDKSILCLPTVNINDHNIIRVPKHIRQHAEIKLKNDRDIYIKLDALAKTLSKLGELWTKYRTTESKLEINITTAPKAFCLLGHLGPDETSCWAQTSDKPFQKYTLGQSLETFVCIISKFDEKKQKFKQIARGVGFANKNNDCLSLHNMYFSRGASEGDVLEVFDLAVKDLWKTNKVERVENIIVIDDKHIYINKPPCPRWSFFKEGANIEAQQLHHNNYLTTNFTCKKCRDEERDDRFALIDDEMFCSRCRKYANICEMSNELTFKELVDLFDGDRVLHVSPTIAEKFFRCENCENLMTIKHELDGKLTCPDCVEILSENCEFCECDFLIGTLEEVDGYSLCVECAKNAGVECNV